VFLAKKLREKGIDINVELVDRASLLHDLDKIPTLGKGTHGKVSKEILEGKGYPELAKAVHNHIYNAIFDELTWEDKVINYVDKRCQEDQIHPLKERLKYIRNKYSGKNSEVNDKAEPLFYKLEKEIFDIIGIEPDKLGELNDR